MQPVHCYVQLLQILLHEDYYSGPLKIAIYNEYSSKIVPSINTTKNGFNFFIILLNVSKNFMKASSYHIRNQSTDYNLKPINSFMTEDPII